MQGKLRRFEVFVTENKVWFLLAVFVLALAVKLLYNFLFLESVSSIRTQGFTGSDPYAYYTAAHQIRHFSYTFLTGLPSFPSS